MKVTVRYFASIREALGPSETMELREACSVGALRDQLIALDDVHARALSRGRALRAAVNQAMCDESTLLVDQAEVAFFPPVTGG